jgi:penicillin-binding protein 1A
MKKNKENKQIINTKIKQNTKKQNLNDFWRKFFHFLKINIYNVIAIFLLLCIVGVGFFFLWISSFRIPDFSAFEDRKVAQSTKIYDRTGEILLFDVNQDIKRTVISIEDMGLNIQNAIIAIEDNAFYQHRGVRLRAIARAFVNNLKPGSSKSSIHILSPSI